MVSPTGVILRRRCVHCLVLWHFVDMTGQMAKIITIEDKIQLLVRDFRRKTAAPSVLPPPKPRIGLGSQAKAIDISENKRLINQIRSHLDDLVKADEAAKAAEAAAVNNGQRPAKRRKPQATRLADYPQLQTKTVRIFL